MKPLHVLEILGNAITGGMEACVVRLVQSLPRERYRISALCPFESHVTTVASRRRRRCADRPDPRRYAVADRANRRLVRAGRRRRRDPRASCERARARRAGNGADRPSLPRDDSWARPVDARSGSASDGRAYAHERRCARPRTARRALGVARERLHLVANGVSEIDSPMSRTVVARMLDIADDDLPWAASLGARAKKRAASLWPQREAAARMGELLSRIAESARAGARVRQSVVS